MADAVDLKSAILTGVGVRIPSWAPIPLYLMALIGGRHFTLTLALSLRERGFVDRIPQLIGCSPTL